jgi:tRNA1(Val) A37 N6-methylase TrmN6
MSFAPMAAELPAAELTADAILGGRLHLTQPKSGHRVGHDAILLAAATPAQSGEVIVDLGAGVGAAGLAVAARVPGASITLVEIDPDLAALADDNIHRNGLADRVRALVLDAAAAGRTFAAAGLPAESVSRVLMNPPFNDPARQRTSAHPGRRLAHASGPGLLPVWIRSAARLLRSRGTLTLIWRADGLGDVLQALEVTFGEVMILPVHAKPAAPAIRILVRATKSSRSPLSLLPGLVLADTAGQPTAEAEAVLRAGSVLPLGGQISPSVARSRRSGS